MAEVRLQLIFLENKCLELEPWVIEKLITAVKSELRKQPELDAYVMASTTRKGDFSIVYQKHTVTPIKVQIIGIADKLRAPIITTAYVKG